MLRLWGRLNSINVQKVVWALEELGCGYERLEAGMAHGVVDTSAFRAMNPNGRVPVLEDGGEALWESNAIVRHLGRTRGGRLWPSDPVALARAERWMDWQLGTLEPPMRIAFWGIVRRPERYGPAEVEAAMRDGLERWTILEGHLASSKHVAGDAFTFADIPLGCFWWRFVRLGGAVDRLPACREWGDGLRARPHAGVLAMPLS